MVCQQQVRAASSGVCFTADPSGADPAVVIESISGLGEDLVSGHVAPDRWRVYQTGRGAWEAVPRGMAGASLAPDRAAEVARTARWLAERLGQPLDLEWALDDAGLLWWLQARPITAARAFVPYRVDRPCPAVNDGPVTAWADWNLRETLPDPLRPLPWTLFTDRVAPLMMQELGFSPSSPLFWHLALFERIAGRAYFNINAVLGASPDRKALYRTMDLIDPQAGRMTERLAEQGVIEPRRMPRPSWRDCAGMVRANFKLAVRLLRPGKALADIAQAGEKVARERGQDLTALSDAALLELLEERAACRSFAVNVLMVIAGPWLLDRTKRHFADCPAVVRLLGVGNQEVPTTRITLGVERLVGAARPLAALFERGFTAERLRADPRAAAFNAELAGFLAEFGQRGPGEMDIARPRWADDPSMILELVCAGLAAPAGESTAARMRRLAAERDAAITEAAGRMPWWRGRLLKVLARWIERLMPLREAPKHYGLYAFAVLREAILEVGGRLTARGALARAEDVFFLALGELGDALCGRMPAVPAAIAERQREYADWVARPAPSMLRSDGVPVVDPEVQRTDPDVLAGTPVSSGRVRGPARILIGPDPGAIRPGDVIVMRLADPGWTPMFPLAAGVVMEVGGAMCHAAVVARELGVPAVFGVAGATALADGQLIEIDGDAGTVRLVRA